MSEQLNNNGNEESFIHFSDYWRVIRSRKEIILAVMLLVLLTGSLITFYLPKIYKSTTLLRVEQDTHDVEVFRREASSAYSPYFLLTEFEVIQARPILEDVIQNLGLRKIWSETYFPGGERELSKNDSVAILSKHLHVNQYRNTSLIAVQVSDESPVLASEIANEIAFVYREHRLGHKKSELKRGLDSLESEMLKQREAVDAAEEEVERIRGELGINFFAQGLTVDKIKLKQLEADRIDYRVDMLGRKARLDQLENLEGDDLIAASSFIVIDKTLDNIRTQLLDSEVSLRLLLENLGENHPDVRQLRAGVDELRSKLRSALKGLKNGLRADYEVARAKYEALEEELNLAKESDIDASREKYLPFEKASRNLMIQRNLLEALSSKLSQEGIELQIPMTPVEIVEPAVAAEKWSSPNLLLNIIMSIIAGTFLGLALAFFLEYMDTSVKTVDDIERHLNTSVVGVIPQKAKLLNEDHPDSAHAEAYRVLRTNLHFNIKENGGGAFACLSGGMGEGKSTTLYNLAFTCAAMGDKVILVDSDLRRPVQHHNFKTDNLFGLTNVLLRDVPIEETIKSTGIPNLDFLPSGKLPRTSIGLLDPKRLRELISTLKARYDYVFFDSPPIMGVSDASVLAAEMDAVMLVVQYRKYPRAMSSRAKRLIENAGANIIGVVLNNINILRDDYYYYYNSYYTHHTEDTSIAAKSSANKDAVANADKF